MEKQAIFSFPVIDLIKKRWSPVIFSSKAIPETDALTLMEAAMWAPSSYNDQPWRYIYAHRGSDDFNKIADSLMEMNKEWAQNAALLVISLSKKTFSMDASKPNYHYMYDAGAANAFMINQASSMGIYSHSMGGVYFDKLREMFSIPADLEICSVIAFGYHGDLEGMPENLIQREKMPRQRKPMSDIVLNKK